MRGSITDEAGKTNVQKTKNPKRNLAIGAITRSFYWSKRREGCASHSQKAKKPRAPPPPRQRRRRHQRREMRALHAFVAVTCWMFVCLPAVTDAAYDAPANFVLAWNRLGAGPYHLIIIISPETVRPQPRPLRTKFQARPLLLTCAIPGKPLPRRARE